MNRRNNRRSTRQDDRRWANRTARLHRSAGRARQVADAFLVEPLEQRQFLAGDYPSFNQVFNTSTPQTVPTITINQTTGLGVANGVLTTNGEDDVAKFTAPKTEFITIQADTKSLGGTFDSKVEVYTGTPGGPATLVATGNDSGILTAGLNSDGWVGFIAQAGTTYYVKVSSNSPTGTGAYKFRVDAIPTNFQALIPNLGSGATGDTNFADGTPNAVGFIGGDVVYKVTNGSTAEFDSLMTFNATALDNDFDTHLDVYNSNGTLLTSDEKAGHLSNAFTTTKAVPGQIFYVRVRGDQFSNTNQFSSGVFNLRIDGAATVVNLDPVTRRASVTAIAGKQDIQTYVFKTKGSGEGILTAVRSTPLPLIADPALGLYDKTGNRIAFNDDATGVGGGVNAQIITPLKADERYWALVEDFDDNFSGGFTLFFEANHTHFVFNGNSIWDDHANLTTLTDPVERRRAFNKATPLIWGTPRLYLDSAQNRIIDRASVTDAVGWGRIEGLGDSDVFKFVPQVDMLGSYTGDNDDSGTSIYAGGIFTTAGEAPVGDPVGANRVAGWEAGDWWPAKRGVNGTVLASTTWDPDGPGPLQRSLVVGGQFTTATNDPTQPPIVVNRIAMYFFDVLGTPAREYFWTDLGGGFDNPGGATPVVRALTTYTPPGTNFELLVAVGDNLMGTTDVATFDGGAWTPLAGAEFNGSVNAVTVWDPPDPDGAGTEEDPEVSLAFGGAFTQRAGTSANRLAWFDWDQAAWDVMGAPAANANGVNNTVRALTTWQRKAVAPETEDPAVDLVIAGDFTTATPGFSGNQISVGRIVSWTRFPINPTPPNPTDAKMAFRPMGTTFDNSVFALATMDDDRDEGTTPALVVGGAFSGFIRWTQNDPTGAPQWTAPMGAGLNGTVRALAVANDDPGDSWVYNVSPQLYAGGDFTLSGGLVVNRVAKWEFNPDPAVQAFTWEAMGKGVNNTVHTLTEFDDGNPDEWDRNDRPSGRVAMVVSPIDGSFANMFIAVYDSNLDVPIYTNNTIAPPFPDPAGMQDPAIGGPGGVGFPGISVYAGETYYVVVTSLGNSSTGRYSITVTADAYVPNDVNSTYSELPGAPAFNQAPEIILQDTPGDGNNFLAAANAAFIARTYKQTGGSGTVITYLTDYGLIETESDTDLYFFTAARSGTAEIRINTTQIAQVVNEFFGPALANSNTKTFNSELDSALRIFNNDFEQIAYNDDFPVLGAGAVYNVGTFQDKTFTRRDARVVFDVEAGKRYYIQVESGQADAVANGLPYELGYGSITGAYEMLINTMPNLNGIDDHINAAGDVATVINIGIDQGASDYGKGSVTGTLRDTPNLNPNDLDLFTYIAPASGTATISLSADIGSAFNTGQMFIFDEFTNLVASATMNGSQAASVQVNTVIGERYFIQIANDGPGLGDSAPYRVSVSGLNFVDDYASLSKWHKAKDISKHLYDYDGTETLSGSLEYAGDTDLFRFETIAYEDIASITVTSTGTLPFRPVVRVYEVQIDPAGKPSLWQIGVAGAGVGESTATVVFPLTGPNRTTPITPPPPQKTYNYYYILVEGADLVTDAGNYNITLNVENTTDDHPDAGQWALSHQVVLNPSTGIGSNTGVVELSGDTDLFYFIPKAAGKTTLTLTSPTGSTLLPRIRVFDKNFNPVNDLTTGQPQVTGADTSFSVAKFDLDVLRDDIYYVLVEGVQGGLTKLLDTGNYTLLAFTPAADDHANVGEFNFATNIPLSVFTGDGEASGIIGVEGDTDLFKLRTLNGGKLSFTISTPSSFVTPIVQLFNAAGTSILGPIVDGGAGDADGQQNGTVLISIVPPAKDLDYYLLVSASPTGPVGNQKTGAYEIDIEGPLPAGSIIDDYPNAGQFSQAAGITINADTGKGQITGVLGTPIDSDLFKFIAIRDGRAFVQVLTPKGQALDLGVKIFNQATQQIAANVEGNVAANAFVSFTVNEGETYYVLIEGDTSNIGDYTIRVSVEPPKTTLYFPEGYASKGIREYVSIANSNNFDVTYTIRLYYATGATSTVIAQDAVIKAGSRGGATISNGVKGAAPGVLLATPYSIVIESDAPLGATFAHYDFSAPLGEAFTSNTSTTWNFAKITKAKGVINDFLLVFNPNDTDVQVVLTAFTTSGEITLVKTIGAKRRGGWNINNTPELPVGTFAVNLASAPVVPTAPHIGIVASLSHYDINATSGDASLGDPTGGATRGVYTGLINSGPNTSELVFFNPGAAAANLTIKGTYIGSSLPGITRTFIVPAKSSVSYTGVDLGLTVGQAVGIEFTSDQAITLLGRSIQNQDADAWLAATEVGTNWFFGDAFINVPFAGISYFENLYFYNPANKVVNATIDILFNDATRTQVPITLAANTFSKVELDSLPAILQKGGKVFFSLEIFGNDPFAVSMTHYDLILGGGWGTKGAALGLTNSLADFT